MLKRIACLVAAFALSGMEAAAQQADNLAPLVLAPRLPGVMPLHNPAAPRRFRSLVAPAGAQLTYYGGHVLSNVDVVAVFWGPNVDPTTQSGISGFLTALTSSSFFTWLSEYNTTAAGGTNQTIGPGGVSSVVTITPNNSATSLQDSDIQAELDQQITAGSLPAPTANTLYMTYFPAGMAITLQGSQSCVDFCAYHGTFTRANGSTFYGVLPDLSDSGCNGACGGAAAVFDNLTSVSSHELIESVTDAEVGLATGSTPAAPLAWYDATNGEIGDLCNAQQDSITAADGTNYVVQQEFSNVANDCIVSR